MQSAAMHKKYGPSTDHPKKHLPSDAIIPGTKPRKRIFAQARQSEGPNVALIWFISNMFFSAKELVFGTSLFWFF